MSTPLVGFGSTMVGSDVALRRKILRKAFKSNKITVGLLLTSIITAVRLGLPPQSHSSIPKYFNGYVDT